MWLASNVHYESVIFDPSTITLPSLHLHAPKYSQEQHGFPCADSCCQAGDALQLGCKLKVSLQDQVYTYSGIITGFLGFHVMGVAIYMAGYGPASLRPAWWISPMYNLSCKPEPLRLLLPLFVRVYEIDGDRYTIPSSPFTITDLN